MGKKEKILGVTIAGVGAALVTKLLVNALGDDIYAKKEIDKNGDTIFFIDGSINDSQKGKTSGELLSFYRRQAGLSPIQLASVTDVGYSNIIAIEKNRRNLGLNVAKKLAKALNCKPTDLLSV